MRQNMGATNIPFFFFFFFTELDRTFSAWNYNPQMKGTAIYLPEYHGSIQNTLINTVKLQSSMQEVTRVVPWFTLLKVLCRS